MVGGRSFSKGHIVYDFIYMKCAEKENFWKQEIGSSFVGL
jgi:hypothetical protein